MIQIPSKKKMYQLLYCPKVPHFSFSVVLWCITQCINQDSATMYTIIWKTNSLSAKLHYIAELWSYGNL